MRTPISIIDFDFIKNGSFSDGSPFYETPNSSVPHFLLGTKDSYGLLYCNFYIRQNSHDGEIPEEDYYFSDETINTVLKEYVKYVNKKAWNPYPENTPKDDSHWLVVNDKGQMRSMSYNNGWEYPEFNVIAYRELPEWK